MNNNQEKKFFETNQVINWVNWVIGSLFCMLGIALVTKSNFGLSMISAPPYILHMRLREIFSWYTQGTSEYVFQTLTLIIVCLLGWRFKWKYLLSFLAAVLAGLILDGWFLLLGGNGPYASMGIRILAFALGAILGDFSIAFIFRTTLPVQVPELTVKILAERFRLDTNKMKYIYDGSMLTVSFLFAWLINHSWMGIGIGTVLLTVFNAPLITVFGKVIDRYKL